MRILSILQCIGLVFLWFLSVQIVSVCFQDANITMAMSILIMGLIAFCINRKTGYINFAPRKNTCLLIMLSILTGIGLSFFNAVTMVQMILNGKWELTEVPNNNVLLLSIFSIIGAIAEEIFFRGILQNICRSHFGTGFTIIIPTIIFMVIHFAPEALIRTLVGGLLFGYLYYYTDNIYASIIMHVTTNFMWGSLLNGYLFAFIGSKTSFLAASGAMTLVGLFMLVCLKIIFDKKFVKQ